MWLLNVQTRALVWFLDESKIAGKYAILSHTWQEDEVLFADIPDLQKAERMQGYAKIDYTCRQAASDGFEYAWVDTCCINKADLSELSESINSMFRWYRDSGICYVYLSDVNVNELDVSDRKIGSLVPETSKHAPPSNDMRSILQGARWFTRGWTLQELIAPKRIAFFDCTWLHLGKIKKQPVSQQVHRKPSLRRTRHGDDSVDIATVISYITGIYTRVLRYHDSYRDASIAQRLSWSASRSTTKIEDVAYSLLGLFDISMPLLYGEGSRSFVRLQEELLRTSSDQSILVWKPYKAEQNRLLLAPDPYCFREAAKVSSETDPSHDGDHAITNRGLRTALNVCWMQDRSSAHAYVELNCTYRGDKRRLTLKAQSVGRVVTQQRAPSPVVFEVVRDISSLDQVGKSAWMTRAGQDPEWVTHTRKDSEWTDVVLLKNGVNSTIHITTATGLEIVDAAPKSHWYPNIHRFILPPSAAFDVGTVRVREPQSGETKLLWLQRRDANESICALAWLSDEELIVLGTQENLLSWTPAESNIAVRAQSWVENVTPGVNGPYQAVINIWSEECNEEGSLDASSIPDIKISDDVSRAGLRS